MSQVQSSPQDRSRERRAFLWRKLHSITGVLPIGVFLVLHLWTNAHALAGQQVFDSAVSGDEHLPYRILIEIVGLGLPLAVHVAVGLKILLEMRPNLARYPQSGNVAYVLQRVSGLVLIAFLGWHLWQLRWQTATGRLDEADLFPTLCASLSSTVGPGLPLVAIAYLVGLAAAVFHLVNGLHGFCWSWGITASRQASRRAAALFGVLGLLLFLVGANTVVYFATGTRLWLSARVDPVSGPALSCRDLPPAGAKPTARGVIP